MAILLSREERAVMQAVYVLASDKTTVLVSLEEIMDKIELIGKFKAKRPKVDSEGAEAPEETNAAEEAEAPEETNAAEETEAVEASEPTRRRHFWNRKRPVDEAVAAIEPKVYLDEPPVYRGFKEYRKAVTYAELPHILEILDMEEYFELTEAADDGEIKYVIRLLNRGQRWLRDERDRKRTVLLKLGMAVLTPILSFVLGIVLRTVFS